MKTLLRFIIIINMAALFQIFSYMTISTKKQMEITEYQLYEVNDTFRILPITTDEKKEKSIDKRSAEGKGEEQWDELIGELYTDSPAVFSEDILSPHTREVLAELLGCHNKESKQVIRQRGEFWTLQNYVMADHGPVNCHETITYTTHGDYTFLDNILPLVSNWLAPVSLALFAPGTDFHVTIDSIRYIRDCLNTPLIKEFVTFHIFFPRQHMPKRIPTSEMFLQTPFDCTLPPPHEVNKTSYKHKNAIMYPINVARNLARTTALTHFVLPSDVELYPTPNLVPKFLNMIARNEPPLDNTGLRVFALNPFEIQYKAKMPKTKTELISMMKNKTAVSFHNKVCPACHKTPNQTEWLEEEETSTLEVFATGKRLGQFKHWEPFYICTNNEPLFNERQTWEGKSNKMAQAYLMCVQDYDFMVLNKAFLVHKPGIKVYKHDKIRDTASRKHIIEIKNVILPELKAIYGPRKGCTL